VKFILIKYLYGLQAEGWLQMIPNDFHCTAMSSNRWNLIFYIWHIFTMLSLWVLILLKFFFT